MNGEQIASIQALEVLDSRGNPTVQVTLTTKNGSIGKALVPSGASTGAFEAVELRDKDKTRFSGKGVRKAIQNIEGPLTNLLLGKSVLEGRFLDTLMIEADATPNKSKFGANAILALSLSIAKAAASFLKIPFYRYLGGSHAHVLPCPMMNILNGGAHADNGLDFQEFMIRPRGAKSFSEALRWGTEVYHILKSLLKEENLSTNIGDEGGFAPLISSNEVAIEFILRAIEKAGFSPGKEISLALDCAATEFFEEGNYIEKKKRKSGSSFQTRNSEQQAKYLVSLCNTYPIDSIEDGMAEEDWKGWALLTELLPKIQIVGDDLFVTNTERLKRGLKEKSANSILIKLNQIGTLSETIDCIQLASVHGFTSIISHRSGETADTTIADLAVAMQTGQIKTGAPARTDRVAKYNRLLEIEAELQHQALYRDSNRCRTCVR